jgi:transcriptional regulator with XRE-family HTH domain
MQAQTGPPGQLAEITPYTAGVSRKPNAHKGQRPQLGAHLLALRKAAGLTQIELAHFLRVPHANIAFWEWSDKPPRSDVLPLMAKAFGVRVEELLAPTSEKTLAKHSGPVGEVQRAFEAVRKLPRSQQRRIIETVYALVDQFKRKAS